MAKRTSWLGQAVLLGAAAWVCVDGARAVAQAGVEAGMAGAAASSVGSAAGKATGSALGSVLGQTGAAVQKSTQTTAAPAAKSGGGSATTTGAAGAAAPAPATLPVKFVTPVDVTEVGGAVVEGPPPDIHFDVVSFARCNTLGSTRIDLPLDGDYVAYHCQPVFRIIYFAYEGSTAGTLTLGGYPAWVETDLYNFEAKVAPEDVATWQKLSLGQRRMALRGLLADALKLKIKADATPKPVYLLGVGNAGPKLKEYAEGEQQRLPNGLMLTGKDMSWVGRVAYFQGISMGVLADSLSSHLDRQVLDRTGLTGAYDVALSMPYGSDANPNVNLGENIPSVAEELSGLGLHLEAAKIAGDGLLVQHVERPTEQ